ncbi:MAG: hypothetical protein Q7K29_02160 [Thermoleophilia bacterium]|nr:hypothetical protein [Thermoleophilia bacterium]
MDHLELFLVSAIVTILVVRIFLELTGYPQVGGSVLHIAHVLWGGLLMAVGIIILFTLLGKKAEAFGTLVGGIGFGLFIDEVGKFVTNDNDYFFQASVAIMYVVFVFLYLISRWILTSEKYSETEYLVNSINEMRELPIGMATEDERRLILFYLSECGSSDPLAAKLNELVADTATSTAGRPGPFLRFRKRLFDGYRGIVARRWFVPVVKAFFIIQFIGSLGMVLTLLLDPGTMLTQLEAFSFSDWAILASTVVSAFFIALGVLNLRRSRLEAFRMFERSVLVQILVGQLFLFYKDEFSAIPGFIFYLLLLLALRFIIQRERSDMITAAIAPEVQAK